MATDFTKKPATEFLKAEDLPKHAEQMAYFHMKLSELHHNVFFLQQIIDFPFDLFVMPGSDLFLRIAIHNFLQVSVLQITKLTTDSGGDARTLKQFKNLMSSAVKEEYLADYRKLLKKAKFKPRIDELIGKAKNLRDKQIAHSVTPGPGDRLDPLTFEEIKEIVTELTNLFEVASFNTEYRYLTVSYDPAVQHPAGCDPRPDIQRILDSIACESSVLHLPETNPIAWPHRRESWSPRMLEQFNRYRRRCGLPEL